MINKNVFEKFLLQYKFKDKIVQHKTILNDWITYIKIYFGNVEILEEAEIDCNREDSLNKCYHRTIISILNMLYNNIFINNKSENYYYLCYIDDEKDQPLNQIQKYLELNNLLNYGISEYQIYDNQNLSERIKNKINNIESNGYKITIYTKSLNTVLVMLYSEKTGYFHAYIECGKDINANVDNSINMIIKNQYFGIWSVHKLVADKFVWSKKIDHDFIPDVNKIANTSQKKQKDNIILNYSKENIIAEPLNYSYIKIKRKNSIKNNFLLSLNCYDFNLFKSIWNNSIRNRDINCFENSINLFNTKLTIHEIETMMVNPLMSHENVIGYLNMDIYISEFKKMHLLQKYIDSNKYTKNEIKRIMNMYDEDIKDLDFEMFDSYNYLLEKIFYKNFYDTYNSEDYSNIKNNISTYS